MFGYLRQSTASQSRTIGPFVDDTDFKTLENGLTIANTDIKLKKNGATAVNKNSGGATSDVNGMYAVTFNATDTNTVGEIQGSVSVAGALVVVFKFVVLEEAVFDLLFISGATGDVKLQAITHTGATIPTVTTVDTTTTNTDMRGTDSALAAASAPTNFGDMAITVTTGRVSVGTSFDKTGYSISGTITTLDGLNDFNPATDTVVNVTAVVNVTNDVGITQAGADKAWGTTTRALTDKAGFTIAGTITTLDGLQDISPSQVNSEMLDVLTVDVFAEPSGVIAATSSLADKIGYVFTKTKNKTTQTSTLFSLRNDADSGNISTSTVSDDGSTFTKGEDT